MAKLEVNIKDTRVFADLIDILCEMLKDERFNEMVRQEYVDKISQVLNLEMD